MRRLIFCYLFILFSLSIFCQSEFRNGYVISQMGDTIKGQIDYRGNIKNSQACVFKSETGEVKIYSPLEIAGYKFDGGRYYVSKNLKTGDGVRILFAEFLVDGRKNAYYFRDDSGDHFLIEYVNDTLLELPNKDEIYTEDGLKYSRKSTKQLNYLKAYFNDCPSLFQEIDNMGKINEDNLVRITTRYHNKMCPDSLCIVYYKRKPGIGFALEAEIGAIDYNYTTGSPEYGALVYLWLPRTNERLFLKTGYLVSHFEYEDYTYRVIKVPLQFEYLFPDKPVRPKFDLGVNVFFDGPGYDNSVAANAGVLFKLWPSIYLDLNLGGEITPIGSMIAGEGLNWISYSLNTGLYFRL
jgi:hypothetical protein